MSKPGLGGSTFFYLTTNSLHFFILFCFVVFGLFLLFFHFQYFNYVFISFALVSANLTLPFLSMFSFLLFSYLPSSKQINTIFTTLPNFPLIGVTFRSMSISHLIDLFLFSFFRFAYFSFPCSVLCSLFFRTGQLCLFVLFF